MNNLQQKTGGIPRVALILLAAGASSRMKGTDKLLENIDKTPLLRRTATAAKASSAACVIVVVKKEDTQRRAALAGLDIEIHENPDWQKGMASSIAVAMAVCKESDAVIISLADMPDITGGDYDALIAAFGGDHPGRICRATSENGTPGHPVLFGRDHFEELAGLEGDIGARTLVKRHAAKVVAVPLNARHALTDLDTKEDFARYRQS